MFSDIIIASHKTYKRNLLTIESFVTYDYNGNKVIVSSM